MYTRGSGREKHEIKTREKRKTKREKEHFSPVRSTSVFSPVLCCVNTEREICASDAASLSRNILDDRVIERLWSLPFLRPRGRFNDCVLCLGSPFHRLQVRSSRCFWYLSPVAKVGSVGCVGFLVEGTSA